ncbi:hypothetical protein [Bosea eneae]
MLLVVTSATAQERHPLLVKAIELGAAGSVVAQKCQGLALNPAVTGQLLIAIGLAGLTDQLERITEAEITALAENSISTHWPPERLEEQCSAAAKMTMPNPVKSGETIPLFIQSTK